MSLSLLEFTVFGLHLLLLLAALIAIQILNPGKVIREYQEEQTLLTKEIEDQQEVPFDPTTQTFTMTENPMLRHRTNTNILREAPPLSTEETPEQIRLEDVD